MSGLLLALLQESQQRGFLGPGPVEPHLDHARAFAVVVGDPPANALDLGAGGGLPGLVLAYELWPETAWTFVDAQTKRTAFLVEAVAELGLIDRVRIINDRAEAVGRSDEFRSSQDLVVARSFGSPAIVAECSAPLLRVGGQLVVSEPPDATDSRWPSGGLALFGFEPAQRSQVAERGDIHMASMILGSPSPDRFPRRVGIPAKRPMF